jgi:hypothetical protein
LRKEETGEAVPPKEDRRDRCCCWGVCGEDGVVCWAAWVWRMLERIGAEADDTAAIVHLTFRRYVYSQFTETEGPRGELFRLSEHW